MLPPRSNIPAVSRTSRPSISKPSGIPRRRTALIVDHDVRASRSLQVLLEDEGFEVLRAGEGTAALRLVESHPGYFDVVLVDVILAAEGALEGVRESRPGLPVIYTSSLTTSTSVIGADLPPGAVIRKPCTRDELLGAMSRIL